MEKYKYMRHTILHTASTGQIDVFLVYNGRISPALLDGVAQKLFGKVAERTDSITYEQIRAWIEERFSFNKYNHPSTNAEITFDATHMSYRADGCGGGRELSNLVFYAAA